MRVQVKRGHSPKLCQKSGNILGNHHVRGNRKVLSSFRMSSDIKHGGII